MSNVELNGEKLHYLEQGEGPPLVLLHGVGASAVLWSEVIDMLEGQYQLYAFDLRGHGNSSCNGTFSVTSLAEDIAAATEKLGLESFNLAGVSLGAAVAIHIAAIAKGRVSSLAVGGIGDGMGKLLEDEIYGIREAAHYLTPEAFAKEVVETLLVRDSPPDRLEVLEGEIVSLTKQNYLQDVRALAEADPTATDVEVRALVLRGAFDELVTADAADALALALGSESHVEIPSAGHLINIDNPNAFASALADFIGDGGKP